MIYLFIAAALIMGILMYFRIADHFHIIDKPNDRSSHTQVTIRGGGIVFYLAAAVWFVWSGASYPYFFLGLTLIALVSFLDDIMNLSNRIRILVHLIAVLLLFYQTDLFQLSWYMQVFSLVLVIGTINAYNFMDGINGITAAYSFAVLFLLWLANQKVGFMDDRLLYCTAIGNAVFSFFNFRKKAKCFAGDVGSVSMCFILLFAMVSLLLASENLIFILFFAVYGVDSVLTIAHRLIKRENIFQAHRSHLYQYLANEAKINPLLVSASYGILQLVVGLLALRLVSHAVSFQLWGSLLIISMLALSYILLKALMVKRYATL